MTPNAIAQLIVYIALLLALAWPLGKYMTRVYRHPADGGWRYLGWLERLLYRISGIRSDESMTWRAYAASVLALNILSVVAVYVIQRVQSALPLNPDGLENVSPAVALNTAISFATNTNWQSYGGETTMSYLTQLLALTVQNFVSAATGMAVLAALMRGFARTSPRGLGNFWTDLTRSILYILLPMSVILSLALVSEGVVQSFRPAAEVALLDSKQSTDNKVQRLALGPVASQVAIKQLGTNGGGYFNTNSAHPFENPTPWSNLLEMLAILLIPAALCFTFGDMVGDSRQGRSLLFAMLAIFVPLSVATIVSEQHGPTVIRQSSADLSATDLSSGGNMEGKELRFGITNSALWATATTAASNGSVNAMHDSFTPLGGLWVMWLMQLGEIVFGGVGSGLYGMLMYAIIAVFIAGLMVGRTPEYLGKKIGAFEMKMASLVILFPAAMVLLGTALASATESGRSTVGNPGAHALSEILYAFSSAANNNGSAFGGLTVNGWFYSLATGLAMLVGRYWVIVPVLALAGALSRKQYVPPSAGTLPTHTPLFIGLLVGTILLIGALTFVPSLALGPIVEHLLLSQTSGRVQ